MNNKYDIYNFIDVIKMLINECERHTINITDIGNYHVIFDMIMYDGCINKDLSFIYKQ
jgi:hypothetical protein